MPPSACANCGAPAGLQCPTCLDLKRPTAFCSKACYTSAWPQHKALHRLPAGNGACASPGTTQQPGPPGQHPTSPQPPSTPGQPQPHCQSLQQPGPPGQHPTSPQPPGTPSQHPTPPQQPNSPGQLESPQQASCFELADVPGKGIGAVATRGIKRGERILAERPLFTIDLQARSPEAGVAAAEASVRRLAPELREQVLRLHPGVERPHGVRSLEFRLVNNNALPLGTAAPRGGLFLTAARFNHSCTPNVHHAWNARIGMETLHACRDVAAGEELLLSYIPTSLPRRERQAQLKGKFGFACGCAACSLTGAAARDSDMRRSKLARLDDAVYAAVAGREFDRGLQLVNETLALQRAEGLDDPPSLTRCAYDAYQACKHAGRHRRAREWLEKARDANVQAEGLDAVSSLRFARMLRLPTNAPHDPCLGDEP